MPACGFWTKTHSIELTSSSTPPVVDQTPLAHTVGEYETPVSESFDAMDLADQIAMLVRADAALDVDERIVDRAAAITRYDIDSLLVTNGGGGLVLVVLILFLFLNKSFNRTSLS